MVAQAKPIEGRDGGNSLVVEDGEHTVSFVEPFIQFYRTSYVVHKE